VRTAHGNVGRGIARHQGGGHGGPPHHWQAGAWELVEKMDTSIDTIDFRLLDIDLELSALNYHLDLLVM
jgi:hypothetical protein